MTDSDTFWLSLANVGLGAPVLLFVLALAVCALSDLLSRNRRPA